MSALPQKSVTAPVAGNRERRSRFPGGSAVTSLSRVTGAVNENQPIPQALPPFPVPTPTCSKCREPITGELYRTGWGWSSYGRYHPGCAPHWVREWFSWTCQTCGRTFHVRHRRQGLRYCQDPCSAEAMRRRARRRRATDPTRTCIRCGATFSGRADARYCSTRCRVADHRALHRAAGGAS